MAMTNDPEVFRETWHSYVDELSGLKHTLDLDQWDELEEARDALHDLVDDAADSYTEEKEQK